MLFIASGYVIHCLDRFNFLVGFVTKEDSTNVADTANVKEADTANVKEADTANVKEDSMIQDRKGASTTRAKRCLA